MGATGTQITTLSLFRFRGMNPQVWALGQMQFAHGELSRVPGQQFYRLLGSGRGRFSPWPDWTVYGILQVWESETFALEYFQSGRKWTQYTGRCCESWVGFLKNRSVRGSWGGQIPFEPDPSLPDGMALVLTRATIRTRHLRKFWSYVPHSQEGLYEQPELIYTKGVGEWPLTHMATISIWEGEEGIRRYAYRTAGHREAIEQTRILDWYSEELFSRFLIYAQLGNWEAMGRDIHLPQMTL